MSDYRIATHPILPIPERETIEFTWQGQKLQAQAGETIATALFANGIRTFGYHPKDGSPQGIFCANGQCAQCTVIADGLPLKSCMALVKPGMVVEPVTALPKLPDAPPVSGFKPTELLQVDCLIIGGGPAGLVGGDRTRSARSPDPGGGRQAPSRREAGSANPPLLRVDQRLLRWHARHRHRHQTGGRCGENSQP